MCFRGLSPGYDYDECNAEVLLTRMSARDGTTVVGPKPRKATGLTDWPESDKPWIKYFSGATVRAGHNELEIWVINFWPNRLIGDQLLPPEKRFTRTKIRKFHKDYPLRISGLLEPVRIVFAKRASIEL